MKVKGLRQTPSKRELQSLQLSEITRETKAKVMSHRGKSRRKWIGLPKSKSNSDFKQLGIVTEAVLEKQGRVAHPVVVAVRRAEAARKREELLAYLSERSTW